MNQKTIWTVSILFVAKLVCNMLLQFQLYTNNWGTCSSQVAIEIAKLAFSVRMQTTSARKRKILFIETTLWGTGKPLRLSKFKFWKFFDYMVWFLTLKLCPNSVNMYPGPVLKSKVNSIDYEKFFKPKNMTDAVHAKSQECRHCLDHVL